MTSHDIADGLGKATEELCLTINRVEDKLDKMARLLDRVVQVLERLAEAYEEAHS